MTTITTAAQYAEALQAKFAANGTLPKAYLPGQHTYVFATSAPGRKYTRVTMHTGNQTFAHAFINNTTGEVHKPAGWSHPVTTPRYASMDEALAAADWAGGYLYR